MSNNEEPALMYNDGTLLVTTQNQINCFESPKSKIAQVVRSVALLRELEIGKLNHGGGSIIKPNKSVTSF